MKLSGWQRIGIVGSILWFFVGGFIGNDIAIKEAGTKTTLWFDGCVAANKKQFGEYGPYELDTLLERARLAFSEER